MDATTAPYNSPDVPVKTYALTGTSCASEIIRPVARPQPDQALAAVLRRLRAEREESQETVAHRAGLTKGALYDIEAGRASPAWSTVRALAGALEVNLRDLGAAVEAE